MSMLSFQRWYFHCVRGLKRWCYFHCVRGLKRLGGGRAQQWVNRPWGQFRTAGYPLRHADPHFYISMGEHPAYNEVNYSGLTGDKIRNDAYLSALGQHAAGKVCLDIGTGADAYWALECVRAGASKVYAIEVMPGSLEAARRTIAARGAQDKIELLAGMSTEVELPERVDLCVSEIIGTIGSSEGAVSVIRDAYKRFLKQDAIVIPELCVSHVAFAELPAVFYEKPRIGPWWGATIDRIFETYDREFDLRLCLYREVPRILSTQGEFERIDFSAQLDTRWETEIDIVVERPGCSQGLVVWIELFPLRDSPAIDALASGTNWPVVFLPIFDMPMDLKPGDRLQARCRAKESDDGVHPDYFVEGVFTGHQGTIEINCSSLHHVQPERRTKLHEKLFRFS